jgi:hypothetical protein
MMAPKFISKDLASLIHTGKFSIEIEGSDAISELFEKVIIDNDLMRV